MNTVKTSLIILMLMPIWLHANTFNSAIDSLIDTSSLPFCFGVASGDPQRDKVVIWTKLHLNEDKTVNVNWEVASDTLMKNIVQSGIAKADASSAFTVKILVSNLQPHTKYFYRFSYNGKNSPTGRTKTAPENASLLRFAIVSCNNYTNGYFNAYRLVAGRNDIDAVIHLGDYIYEYGNNHHKKYKPVRLHIPDHEIISLEDYRSRYAQYRLDKDLQEAHRLHPFITIWDDHEIANNAYKDGAQNHQANEGEWSNRTKIARKVYFEWLPIPDNDDNKIIRKMSYGNLADIFMLDERLEGRSKQLQHYSDSSYLSPERHMIGDAQADWLTSGLKESKARWKVIANQVVFSELDVSGVSKKTGRIMDIWDGYPFERNKLMDFFYNNNMKNLIFITGDIHSSWAFDLVRNPSDKKSYNHKTGEEVIGAEFVCTSVSSSNADERAPRGLAKLVGNLVRSKKHNPHLKYNNIVDHGYMTLTLSTDEARCDWYYCKTVKERTVKQRPSIAFSTHNQQNKLVKAK